MSVGWSGPDPVGFSDGAGATYELGTRYTAVNDVTINNVRVWAPVGGAARLNRAGKIWSTGGALLATAVMPDTLPSGWSTYPLNSPVPVVAGSSVVVSYDITNTYGARVGGFAYPLASNDGNVQAVERRLSDPATDVFPPSAAGNTFYGIDIDYAPGISGNQAPVVGITATSLGLSASATLTITDESPGTVTYVIEWGDGQKSIGLTTLGPHSHTYAAAGTYAVMVTATDNDGLTDSAATVLQVTVASGSDGVIYQCAVMLLAQVKAQVAATAAGLPANVRSCVVPGQLAWDCCELLAVEWLGNFFTSALPTPSQQTDDGCKAMLGMTFRVTVLRCTPLPDDAGNPPSCTDLDAAAQIQFIDSLAVTRGVAFASKALEDANTVLSYSFGGAVPTGPQGGCVGVTMDVTFGAVNNVGAC